MLSMAIDTYHITAAFGSANMHIACCKNCLRLKVMFKTKITENRQITHY